MTMLLPQSLLQRLCYYFITGKISKLFDKMSEKFDLVGNWTVIGKLVTLPLVVISSL